MVAVVYVPHKIKNDTYEELGIEPFELVIRKEIGVIVSPEELDEVPRMVEKLKKEQPEYKNRIVELRNENIYNFKHSSEVGAKHIIDLVKVK